MKSNITKFDAYKWLNCKWSNESKRWLLLIMMGVLVCSSIQESSCQTCGSRSTDTLANNSRLYFRVDKMIQILIFLQ